MREFVAHSENKLGEKHQLKQHLLETAKLVESYAPSKKFIELFHLAGLLHDVGKFQDGFQEYLENGKPRTPHAAIGAYIARDMFKKYLPLPFVIKGHHAGLPNKQDLIDDIKYFEDYTDLVDLLKNRLYQSIGTPDHTGKVELTDIFELECLTRFLFSSLTDADWLDTEKHFSKSKFETRKSNKLDYERLIETLENEFAKLPTEGKINELRTKAREESAKQSLIPPGFFSLQLPTGLGKTLTSIYWALLHAKKNELDRIIIVLPYINIIDQTASILKSIFGEENIIEHHSGVIDEDANYEDELPDNHLESYKRLACENWDAPIIVTTSVQFFESLFSNKSFKCRKNHNIFNSVVIFDEIQTLPKHLSESTIVMLKNIASFNMTSFLFCTATLPAFSKRNEFDGIENIMSLITNPKVYFNETRRVEYKLINELNPISLDTVAENILQEKDSYLVIVNTKAVAKELFQKVSHTENERLCFHLSTSMCPDHRKKTIANIINNLNQKRKIGVISTQLVEAGVDFDFPTVYRAIAPLDAVIQAAGRCNRNDLLNGKKGNVILFKLENQKMPDKTYSACADITEVSIKDDINTLHEIDSYERYYKTVVSLLVDVDKYKINDERKNFNFKTVSQQYKIIDEATTPLFIEKYSDESIMLLLNLSDELKFKGFITRESYRKLQQYSVQVYPNFLKKYNSQIEKIGDTFLIWHGNYDFNFGLSPEDIETVF